MKALIRTIYLVAVMAMLVIGVMMSGCTAILTAREAREMTPEQIKAYREQQMDVYQCANLSGPPPTGGLTFMLVPKDSKLNLAFGSNCSLLKAEVVP